MEFLVAALFVAVIIEGIIIFDLSYRVKNIRDTCWETFPNHKKAILRVSDISKIIFKEHKTRVDELEKKMQDEKIRTEEFVHGVYKDYTNYIDTKWMDTLNAVIVESKNAKIKPVTAKRTSK